MHIDLPLRCRLLHVLVLAVTLLLHQCHQSAAPQSGGDQSSSSAASVSSNVVTATNRTVLAWFTTRHRQDADIKAGIGWFAQNVHAVTTASPTTHHLGDNLTLDAFDFNQACACSVLTHC